MRKLLEKILLLLVGIAFSLALCEAALWFFGIEYPQFYDFDPLIGAKLRPNMQGYWLKEGGGYVSINSDGLRDKEHDIDKPPNTLRIAVLGDSYPEALQVNRNEAFWAIMEKDLQSCSNLRGRNIEVINFGQSGFGTTQELLALRHRAWKYSPDIILLTFCTGNDLADNSPRLNQRETDPFFVFQGNDLVLDDTRTKKTAENWKYYERTRNWLGDFYIWRRDTFRLLQVLEHSQMILRNWWAFKNPRGEFNEVRQDQEIGLFNPIYREPTDEIWQEAWKVTEAVLLKMQDEIVRKGAQLIVVVITNGGQVDPDVSVRTAVAHKLGVSDLFYPDRRVERFCQSHGIPVLLLAPSFQEYATQHQVFLHGFKKTIGTGHWNQNGHRLAGQTIAKWLCPRLN